MIKWHRNSKLPTLHENERLCSIHQRTKEDFAQIHYICFCFATAEADIEHSHLNKVNWSGHNFLDCHDLSMFILFISQNSCKQAVNFLQFAQFKKLNASCITFFDCFYKIVNYHNQKKK